MLSAITLMKTYKGNYVTTLGICYHHNDDIIIMMITDAQQMPTVGIIRQLSPTHLQV